MSSPSDPPRALGPSSVAASAVAAGLAAISMACGLLLAQKPLLATLAAPFLVGSGVWLTRWAVHREQQSLDAVIHWLDDARGRSGPVPTRPPARGKALVLGQILDDLIARIEQLRSREGRYRRLIEASRTAIYVVADDRLIYVNPQFAKLFGLPIAEIARPGFDLESLVVPGSVSLVPSLQSLDLDQELQHPINRATRPLYRVDITDEAAALGPVPVFEVQGRTHAGELLDLEVVAAAVHWDGEPAIMGMLNNVTERKLAALERERELLTASREQLAESVRELADRNEQLRQFTRVVSHDLKEPLRTVASYGQLLSRRYSGQLDTEAEEFLQFMVGGVNRMKQLIEDLLAFSRLENQHTPRPVDCDEILHTVLANLHSAVETGGARIEIESLPRVLADPSRLVQLFQNLIANAIKFCREETPVVRISAPRRRPVDLRHRRQRNRNRSAVSRTNLLHLPTPARPRELRRNGYRPDHLPSDRRAARREDLGRVDPGTRLDVLFHPGSR